MSPGLLSEGDEPIRISEVAKTLNVSDKWVRRRIDSGELKSIKLGGFRVILRRDFKAFWQKLSGEGEVHHV